MNPDVLTIARLLVKLREQSTHPAREALATLAAAAVLGLAD